MSRFEVKTQWEARGETDSTVMDPENQTIYIYDSKRRTTLCLSVDESLELWNQVYDAADRARMIQDFPETLKGTMIPFSSKKGVLEVLGGQKESVFTNPQDSKVYQAIVDRMVNTGEITRDSKGYLNVAVS